MWIGGFIVLAVVLAVFIWRYRGRWLTVKDQVWQAQDAQRAAEEKEKAAITLLGAKIEADGNAIVAADDRVGESQVDVKQTAAELAKAKERVQKIKRLMKQALDDYEAAKDDDGRTKAKARHQELKVALTAAKLVADELETCLTEMQEELALAEADLAEHTQTLKSARTQHKAFEAIARVQDRQTRVDETTSAFALDGGRELAELTELAKRSVNVKREQRKRRRERRDALAGTDIDDQIASLDAKDSFKAALAAHRAGTAEPAAATAVETTEP